MTTRISTQIVTIIIIIEIIKRQHATTYAS